MLHRSFSEQAWARLWQRAGVSSGTPSAGWGALPDWLVPLPLSVPLPDGGPYPAPTSSPPVDDPALSVLAVAAAAVLVVELRVWIGVRGLIAFACVDHRRGAALVRQLGATAGAERRAPPARGIQVSAFTPDALLDVLMALVPECPSRGLRRPVTLPFARALELTDAGLDERSALLADLAGGRLGSLDVRVLAAGCSAPTDSLGRSAPDRLMLGSWLLTPVGPVHLRPDGELLTHLPVTRDDVHASLLAAITVAMTADG